MNLVVNGKPRTLADGETLLGLLAALGLSAERVVVERNRDIVPRERFAALLLSDGDRLEIVQFVGGG